MPGRQRVGVLYDEKQTGAFIQDALKAARQQGLNLVPVAVRSQEDVAHALSGLLPKIDVFWLIQDQVVVSESSIPVFLESSLNAGVPIFTFSSTLVQQGAVGALVSDPWAVGRQAARLSLTRLKDTGALAGTLVAPEHPQWALNLKSAEHFNIRLNPELIQLAGQVFSGSGPIAHMLDSSALIP
jgi:putative ABC transport system substrate-binding protein